MHLSLLSVGIDNDEPIILLCPQSDERHAWHSGHWPTLVRLLAQERMERLVVLGAEGLALSSGAIQVAPVYDSLTLAALLARVSLVVAPDTGILQLAVLLGIPAIGLYGPTSPASWTPLPGTALCHREFPCHPCRDLPCQERHCMRTHAGRSLYRGNRPAGARAGIGGAADRSGIITSRVSASPH